MHLSRNQGFGHPFFIFGEGNGKGVRPVLGNMDAAVLPHERGDSKGKKKTPLKEKSKSERVYRANGPADE